MLGFQRTDPNRCGGQPNTSKGVVFCPVRSLQDLQLQFSATVVVFFCFLIRNNIGTGVSLHAVKLRQDSCRQTGIAGSSCTVYKCVHIMFKASAHYMPFFFQSRLSIFLLHLLTQVSKNVKLILASFQCQDLHIQTK